MLVLACLLTAASADAPTTLQAWSPPERVEFLQQKFDEATPAAKKWYWGFAGGLAALTVVQGVGLIIAPEINLPQDLRNTLAVGAISSLVGVAGHMMLGFSPAFSAEEFRTAPLTGDAKLALGEKILRRDAAVARAGRNWFGHVTAVVLGLASGLTMWLGFNQLRDGIVMLAVTVAVSELRIWTQPMRAAANEGEYDGRLTLQVVGAPGGAGLALVY